MADNKSCEGVKEISEASYKVGVSTEKAGIDIANTLKGLKAIQREAKKATAALKRLESTESKIYSMYGVPANLLKSDSDIKEQYEVFKKEHEIGGYKPQTVIFDEMHKMCIRCGSTNREIKELITGDEKIYAVKITCSDCGYSS